MLGMAHTPERRHVTLVEALTKRGDALGGEFAVAVIIDTAERVLVQTARGKQ